MTKLERLNRNLNDEIKRIEQQPDLDSVYQSLVDASVKIGQAVRGLRNREREKTE